MIVLDTNVISETSKPLPNAALVAWLTRQEAVNLYLTDLTVMEMVYGGEKYRLKTGSSRYVDNVTELVQKRYRGRILRWDETAVGLAGRMRALRENAGRSLTIQDAIIAAICLSNGATLATRNVKDFEGLDLLLINPFEGT
ncbi:type II toxin-antitoxin system VapC family toxin [Rhizobium sp. KVB221]|uniref:Ribonuclease VapC n=1 Tax=Rhizobium setariae TaxID=2801340 RepID=A0A937CIT5_9HYPH|nr:type II toxin-antitoxin system VapC family toxin [Rhizobium setariae]MBL0370430.1 type II toxin-antitoxin system VapC family toxin [Rhizobium setariae]